LGFEFGIRVCDLRWDLSRAPAGRWSRAIEQGCGPGPPSRGARGICRVVEQGCAKQGSVEQGSVEQGSVEQGCAAGL